MSTVVGVPAPHARTPAAGTATDTTDQEGVLETRIAYRCFIPLSVRALSGFIFGALYQSMSGLMIKHIVKHLLVA